jgi:iron complex transport system ATP-binding protein
MIRVENIVKTYDIKKVLDGINVNVPKNQITTIMGPNGAGKSTLLGIIARLLSRDKGSVYVEGRDVVAWETSELAKKLSILKQDNVTNLKITIREIVSFGRYPHSKGKLTDIDQKRIDEALNFVQLADIQHRYINELSGGQKQRAFIAALLAQDTDYILLDEPLNNLDIKYMVDTMQLLRRLVLEKDKTVILVLHDINFAASYSDYLIVLKDGKLVKEGGVREVITPEVLKEIYELEFNVLIQNDKPLCLYY